MTTQEIIDYYANLLILQYLGQPKAYATIQALVKPVIMDQLPIDVQNAFELETAEGVQLDVIGKYAGVTRYVNDFNGPVQLDDSDFRLLIKIAIVENSQGSSLFDIQSLLNIFFPGQILVFDHLGMRMSYFYDFTLSTQLAEVLVREKRLPKPMAVQLGSLIYFDPTEDFYGFRTYEMPGFMNEPFNTYDVFNLNWPWLSYSNAVGSGTPTPFIQLGLEQGDVLLQENGDLIYLE